MKICILGGSGFIGGHCLNRLCRYGYQVLAPTRNPGITSVARVTPGVSFRALDIFDPNQLEAAISGCQVVINLVGILNESGRDGSGFERVHVGLVESAIAICQRLGVRRFIHISALNAGTGDSYYLRSKGEGELRLRQSSLDWTILRPSVVFGAGDQFLNRFAFLLRLGRGLMPLACPGARMQPVYVGDVATALDRVIHDSPGASGQVFELAGPRVYTLIELVRYCRDLLGLPGPVIGLPASLSKLQAALLQWLPGKPFSPDNYRSLQFDSVSERADLQQLKVTPTALEAIAPRYLGDAQRAVRYQRHRRRAGRDGG